MLHIEANYIKDELNGVYKTWYSNGKGWREETYVNGKLQSVYCIIN